MAILIRNEYPQRVNQRLLRQAIKETLTVEGVRDRAVEVSIALVDDSTMQGLNAQYRGKDRPTDVLSFAQAEGMPMPGTLRLLGDVVISVDTARRQAETEGRTLDAEVSQLAIHGVLHLLGYDDVTDEGYTEMVTRGRTVWERVVAGNADAPARERSDEK